MSRYAQTRSTAIALQLPDSAVLSMFHLMLISLILSLVLTSLAHAASPQAMGSASPLPSDLAEKLMLHRYAQPAPTRTATALPATPAAVGLNPVPSKG